MIERIIIIDNVDPVIFYGVNNSNIQLIRNLFPKLRLAARGNVIKVIGDDAETSDFETKVKKLADYCAKYNQLPEDVIIDTIKGAPPKELKMDDVIIYGVNGKPITGRTPNQQKLVKTFLKNDLTFALGPAGTGRRWQAAPGRRGRGRGGGSWTPGRWAAAGRGAERRSRVYTGPE